MSFGCSLSDIVTLVQLTTGAYSNWKNACGEYNEITSVLNSLNVILERLRTEVTTPNSPLQRGSVNYQDQVTLLGNSATIVAQLNDVIVKFQHLGQSRRSNWDRLRLANRNLGEMRSKLISHTSLLSAFLDTINVGTLGRIEQGVRGLPEMVNTINKLAADMRTVKRAGSVMTAHEDDDPRIWREFRRELIEEGYSSDSIQKYRTQLKRHLRALHADGLLDEDAPPSPCGSGSGSNVLPRLGEAVQQGREQPPLPSAPDEQIGGDLLAHTGLQSVRPSRIGAALPDSGLRPAATAADHLAPSAPFVAGIESEGTIRTHDGECTSTNDSGPLSTNDEPRNSRHSSSGGDEEWFPTKEDAADFAQANPFIWPLTTDGSSIERPSCSISSSTTDEGDSPESSDALSDSDTAMDDQATEIRDVMSQLNEKRNSFVPHRTPPLPDGWSCHFDHERGLFYVDEWAPSGENKIFSLPPVAEKYPESPLPGGWRRIESPTGRIRWLHESGLVSNEHPGHSVCIRIGCISHDKCMRICGRFGSPNTGEVGDASSEFEIGKPPAWEHVGNNSRMSYDNFQLLDTTLECQLTSASWYQRPEPVPSSTIESAGADNDTLALGWQKRHDFLGRIYFVHLGSNGRTSVDPGWRKGTGIARNSELPAGWYQQHDERGRICFVEQSGAIEHQHYVDPSWKLQWKTFFAHRKLESSST